MFTILIQVRDDYVYTKSEQNDCLLCNSWDKPVGRQGIAGLSEYGLLNSALTLYNGLKT